MALGPNDALHFAVSQSYWTSAGYGDMDIFYRGLTRLRINGGEIRP